MTIEQYTCELETLIEDAGITIRNGTVKKLVKRAKELESETDFSEEDVYDELIECIPAALQDDESTIEVLSYFCDAVFAELENSDGVESSDEED